MTPEQDARIWRPNPGPQRAFLESPATELLYGGRKGGGKSDAILVAALRRVMMPGYNGLLLRRTSKELTTADGLLARAWSIFPGAGGVPSFGGHTWTWENAGGIGRIDLSGMEHVQDRYKFAGTGWHFVGFDELTTFEKIQYLYMLSCMKPTHGIPLRARSTTNPGGVGHYWVLDRWGPFLKHQDPDYEGELATYGRLLHYAFDRKLNDHVRCAPGTSGSITRSYIPASYKDTPQIDAASYEAMLDQLDPLTRAQLRDGNWLAQPGGGMMFKREWFSKTFGTLLTHPRPGAVFRVRAWDLAATPEEAPDEGEESNQAATAGVLMAAHADGTVVVEHVVRLCGSPGEVDDAILETGLRDKEDHDHQPLISLPQDPGQAGVHQKKSFGELLSPHGLWWECTTERGDKIERAKPYSSACEHKRVAIVKGDWTETYLRELQNFPMGLKDQVDASSRAYAKCLGSKPLVRSRDRNKPPTRELARHQGNY